MAFLSPVVKGLFFDKLDEQLRASSVPVANEMCGLFEKGLLVFDDTKPRICVYKAAACALGMEKGVPRRELLQWLGRSQQQVHLMMNRLVCDDQLERFLAFGVCASWIDRGIADIHATQSGSRMIMRHLLESGPLQRLLGTSFTAFFLDFMAHPNGANVRNLFWHGFIGVDELPLAYCHLMHVLLPSVGHFLHIHSISVTPRPRYLVASPCDDFPCLVTRGPILFHRAVELLAQGRITACLALILPRLEHLLRLLYCDVNNLDLRQAVACSTELYTTLDMFLQTQDNRLVAHLGPHMMNALVDIFIAPGGPRVRDRISHSEADIAPSVAAQTLVLWSRLLNLDQPFTYQSSFHPMVLAMKAQMEARRIVDSLCSPRQYSLSLSLRDEDEIEAVNRARPWIPIDMPEIEYPKDTLHASRAQIRRAGIVKRVSDSVIASVTLLNTRFKSLAECYCRGEGVCKRSEERAFYRLLDSMPQIVHMYRIVDVACCVGNNDKLCNRITSVLQCTLKFIAKNEPQRLLDATTFLEEWDVTTRWRNREAT